MHKWKSQAADVEVETEAKLGLPLNNIRRLTRTDLEENREKDLERQWKYRSGLSLTWEKKQAINQRRGTKTSQEVMDLAASSARPVQPAPHDLGTSPYNASSKCVEVKKA